MRAKKSADEDGRTMRSAGTTEKGDPVAIEATCHHCKKQFSFTDDYAGRILLCRECGNTFEIPDPAAAAERAAAAAEAAMPMPKSQRRGIVREQAFDDEMPVTQTHAREGAGKICGVLGILYVLAALAIGVAAMVFSSMAVPAKYQPMWNDLTMIVGWTAAITFFVAIVYFICGSCISGGGMISVWLMFLITLVQLISSICGLGYQIFGLAMNSPTPVKAVGKAGVGAAAGAPPAAIFWTAMVVGFVMLILHAKLFMCVTAILSSPRRRVASRSAALAGRPI